MTKYLDFNSDDESEISDDDNHCSILGVIDDIRVSGKFVELYPNCMYRTFSSCYCAKGAFSTRHRSFTRLIVSFCGKN